MHVTNNFIAIKDKKMLNPLTIISLEGNATGKRTPSIFFYFLYFELGKGVAGIDSLFT